MIGHNTKSYVMDYEEKEQDTFPTVYQKDFIWHKNVKRIVPHTSVEATTMLEEDQLIFINSDDIKKIPREEQLKIIQKLYSQRMMTSYQEVFCKGKKDLFSIKGPSEDTLISEAIKLYSDRCQKVLAPPLTARRVNGYCRPAYYYTGLSEYQGKYSYFGYKQLLKQGDNRLAPKIKNCPKT